MSDSERVEATDGFFVPLNDGIDARVYAKAIERYNEVAAATHGTKKNVPYNHKLFKDILGSLQKGGPLFKRAEGAVEDKSLLWLSEVRDAAKWVVVNKKVPAFKGISTEDLYQFARFSVDESAPLWMAEKLAEYGVVLIHAKQSKGMKVDGAVFLIESGNPVVALTLRYARLDNYWFTLMHELSHIVLHYGRLDSPIVDDLDAASTELVEIEANNLARESFVPRSEWRNCPPKYNLRSEVVIDYAREQGLHSAIIAGMLRHDLKRFDVFSDLVSSVNTRKLVFNEEV
jgi:HTH-type transcriptional regulator/antitoxin HigA